MSTRTVYLDNNATTPVAEEVFDAMRPFLTEQYANPSSVHALGRSVRKTVDEARAQVSGLLNCLPEEIVFTSCGSESINTAIQAVLETNPAKRHVILTRVEHPAAQAACRYFESRGCRLTELPVDSLGRLDLNELEDAIGEETALVSVMHANNETGVVFPMEEVARIVKARGVPLHCDAVQSVGKIPVDLRRFAVDLLSLSGHKFHAPKGIGVLFVREGTDLPPLIKGGGQENGRRGGTENVAYIVGLAKACELAQNAMEQAGARMAALRDRLEAGLLRSCPDAAVNGDPKNRLPNTLSMSFEYVESEDVLPMLDKFGICASAGSACAAGSVEPSHVLRAMGVPFTRAHGTIRFSLSRYTTEEEIAFAAEKMPGIVEELRAAAPAGGKSPKG